MDEQTANYVEDLRDVIRDPKSSRELREMARDDLARILGESSARSIDREAALIARGIS